MTTTRLEVEKTLSRARTRPGRGAAMWIVIAMAILGAAAWYFWFAGDRGENWRYTSEPAVRTRLVVSVTTTGTVEPTNQVEMSSELSGVVESVLVDDNDTVTPGQVLATLETDKLDAAQANAEATLASRRAKVALAEAALTQTAEALKRTTTLLARGLTSQESFIEAKSKNDQAAATLQGAKADVDAAQAELTVARTNRELATIRSPIGGVVLERDVEVGQIVASSLQAPVLFTLAEDLSRMELKVDIDEADIGKIKIGDKANFTVEAFEDRSFPAEIAELGYMPETIDNVVTYKGTLTLDNSDRLLRPGMTATAEIIVSQVDDAIAVPNAALRFTPIESNSEKSGGGRGLIGLLMPRPPAGSATSKPKANQDGRRTLWVLRDGAPVAVSVRTGRSDGTLTEIVEGDIAPGDPVITDMAAQ